MTATIQKINGNGTALAPSQPQLTPATMEALMMGDLSKLTGEQRVAYYVRVCESTGLNAFTKPFDYILLNGKLQLYSTKNCTDQLRSIHGVSVSIVRSDTADGVHTVTAKAAKADGRHDEDIGAVSIANLKGDALANAKMKAVTKAKRRVTLSICGLSMLDESELETVKGADRVTVDMTTGEIVQAPSGVLADVVGSSGEGAADVAKAMAAKADNIAEDRAIAADWVEAIGQCADAEALAKWCGFHGAEYMALSKEARGRPWTALRKAAERLGVKMDDVKDWIAESAADAAGTGDT